MFFFLFHDISSGILYRHINTDISRAMYPLAIDKELSMLGDVIRCRPIWNVAFRLTPFGKNPKALTHSLTAIGELRSWIKCKATYAKLSLMFSLRCTSSSLTYIYFPFVCFSYVFVEMYSLTFFLHIHFLRLVSIDFPIPSGLILLCCFFGRKA